MGGVGARSDRGTSIPQGTAATRPSLPTTSTARCSTPSTRSPTVPVFLFCPGQVSRHENLVTVVTLVNTVNQLVSFLNVKFYEHICNAFNLK